VCDGDCVCEDDDICDDVECCEAEPVRDELCVKLLVSDWLLVPLPLRVSD
jgi:hypothetical protein